MLLIYNCFIKFYSILILFVSFFNKKAKKWVSGRKNANFIQHSKSIWFHFASLGEFEQGRPVLEQIRASSNLPVVITFFSPSGYEVRKNTPLADQIYYLPLDSAKNAEHFIQTINPVVAVFTKYEYWYHYFDQLHQRQIPLYIISGIFRPDQVFFKWYGGLYRKMLGFVTFFFVQDADSQGLLNNIGINNLMVSGDTRFDRVWANAQKPADLPLIKQFKGNSPVFIGGSTWPDDEELITTLVPLYREWKFIVAPHETSESNISGLMDLLPKAGVIRFSKINSNTKINDYRVLVIDNVGMLSSLYQYADIAFIGGGFGAGIHNTLEAAAFGVPVIFGPKYQKFKEARDMISMQIAYSINNIDDLKEITSELADDEKLRRKTGTAVLNFVQTNVGATNTIVKELKRQVKELAN